MKNAKKSTFKYKLCLIFLTLSHNTQNLHSSRFFSLNFSRVVLSILEMPWYWLITWCKFAPSSLVYAKNLGIVIKFLSYIFVTVAHEKKRPNFLPSCFSLALEKRRNLSKSNNYDKCQVHGLFRCNRLWILLLEFMLISWNEHVVIKVKCVTKLRGLTNWNFVI